MLLWGVLGLLLGAGVTFGILAAAGVFDSSTAETTAVTAAAADTTASTTEAEPAAVPEPTPVPEPTDPGLEYGERFSPLFSRVARLQGLFANIRPEVLAGGRDAGKVALIAVGAERLSEDFLALKEEIVQLGPPPPEWEEPIGILIGGISVYEAVSLKWSDSLRQEDDRSERARTSLDLAIFWGDSAKGVVDDAMAQLAPLLPLT